ncbi:5-formyltetrahydrofolate cyclo-ligase [Vibrio sp.]|nr:5-formyltetrahydrofolate cyclo-ligase [Vibrio sp.]
MSLSRHDIRQMIRVRRKALSSSTQSQAALSLKEAFPSISKQIKKIKHDLNIAHVALYLSNAGEIETFPFIQHLWKQGVKTYLPVLHPFSKGQLLFLHYHSKTQLVPNKYGILEPKLDVRDVIPTQKLDIIFTPLVAFDETGNRLGMGGGYYDRTLERWHRYNIPPVPVGLAHNEQYYQALPTETWDVPLPIIFTPDRLWSWINN